MPTNHTPSCVAKGILANAIHASLQLINMIYHAVWSVVNNNYQAILKTKEIRKYVLKGPIISGCLCEEEKAAGPLRYVQEYS